uniref:Uncharacterized protein n=1 Tax=Anopheles maculatus TaxID=74869 RepID=A0A182SSL0_9DIPT
MVKEHLECKQSELLTNREEANELRTLLEAAQQQNAMLSAELAGLRSGSDNANTKGNSLFGEVADQRNKLMAIISKMKTAYNRLKQEHADCPRQLRQLRDMSQQSERLYGQCIKLIRAAEYEHVTTLKEQTGELHEQVERALRRIRYLEHEMASNSAEWVKKLVLYYNLFIGPVRKRLDLISVKHLINANTNNTAF